MMDGQINNIKLQIKNIDSQLNIFEMQNKSMMGAIHKKSQIMNIGIQILNIGIQTLNYANNFMSEMGENTNDLENKIQEISQQLDIPLRTVYDILKEDKPALPPKKTANILTNAGAKKTTEKARNEFAKALAKEGDKIAKRAIEIAHQEGKKTIKARHIQLALKE
jgi:histone H3/H4